MATAALNGLPLSYESLIVALDALGNDNDTFTFDLVKSRLLQEQQRSFQRHPKFNEGRASALVDTGTRGARRSSKRFADHRCEKCGNLGHRASHCWGKDVSGKRPSNPKFADGIKNKDSALLTEHGKDKESASCESDFVCIISKLRKSKYPKRASSWILDSGCTAHMIFEKSLFETYELVLCT